MLDKRKFVFYFFVILVIFSAVITAQKVNTDPSSIIVVEGQENVNLLCRSGEPITFCSITVPGETGFSLAPNVSPVYGFSYYGSGLEAGQCGVTISRIKSSNDGVLVCSLFSQKGLQQQGEINIIVAVPPNRPELEIQAANRGNSFEIDKEMVATCTSRGGRPEANLTWYLNEEPIYEGLANLELTEEISPPGQQFADRKLMTVSQTLHRYIRATDDGKKLTCRANHFALREGFEEASTLINVNYAPQALPETTIFGLVLDTTAFVNVTIKANPMPRIEWNVNGMIISQGNRDGRFEASGPVDMGFGEYNVTLSIAGLTLEDTTKMYRLKAYNDYGAQDYIIRLSSSPVEDSGIGVGGIIGVVLACLIVLAAITLVIIARATGRWCFAASSTTSATKMSETSDTESAEVKETITKTQRLKNIFSKKSEKKPMDNELQQSAPRNEGGNGENNQQAKDETSIVYAELMLKPSDDTTTPARESTEYAEIVYVRKNEKATPPPYDTLKTESDKNTK